MVKGKKVSEPSLNAPAAGSQTAALEPAQEELAEMEWDQEAGENEEDEDEDEVTGMNDNDNHEAAVEADGEEVTPAMFEQLIQELCAAKPRRHRIKSTNSPADFLKKTARRMPRSVSPYVNYVAMVVTGMSIMALGPMDETEHNKCIGVVARYCDKKTVREHLRIFEELCGAFPFLTSLLPYLVKDKQVKTLHIFTLAQFVDHHGGAARLTDISSIRSVLHKFLRPATTSTGRIIAPLKVHECIKERNFGYNTLCIRRLWTAIDHIAEFDEDPECALIFAQAHTTMPAFLFEEEVVGHFDANIPSKGVFKSCLLVDIYRHLITGPSSAISAPRKTGNGRTTLSRKWHLTKVMPEYLAYVASLLDFILSDNGDWSSTDPSGFKHSLYNNIKTYLNVEYDDFMSALNGDIEDEVGLPDEDLFAWWNRWVYGTSFGDTHAVGNSFTSDPRFENEFTDTRRKILEEGAMLCETWCREHDTSNLPGLRQGSQAAESRAESQRALLHSNEGKE
ncbi:hypothetical protein C8Q80DRAFT_1267467 [Daedaleopsis nitida]|nr:hypothetical protein C8Q80DRAFT_1267467 [Daedaleopsis nitida]